jgi:hypothetical protein
MNCWMHRPHSALAPTQGTQLLLAEHSCSSLGLAGLVAQSFGDTLTPPPLCLTQPFNHSPAPLCLTQPFNHSPDLEPDDGLVDCGLHVQHLATIGLRAVGEDNLGESAAGQHLGGVRVVLQRGRAQHGTGARLRSYLLACLLPMVPRQLVGDNNRRQPT